jgi:hypothetical protein
MCRRKTFRRFGVKLKQLDARLYALSLSLSYSLCSDLSMVQASISEDHKKAIGTMESMLGECSSVVGQVLAKNHELEMTVRFVSCLFVAVSI